VVCSPHFHVLLSSCSGIQLILCGDFLQLPPVKAPKFMFEANCWERCVPTKFHLQKIFRQSDEKFIGMLQQLRMGLLTGKYCTSLPTHTARSLNACVVLQKRCS
jgi:hypothetical protein